MKYAIVRISQIHIYYINRLVLLLSYISLQDFNKYSLIFGLQCILILLVSWPNLKYFIASLNVLHVSTWTIHSCCSRHFYWTWYLFNKVATSIKQKKLENIQTMKHLVSWMVFFLFAFLSFFFECFCLFFFYLICCCCLFAFWGVGGEGGWLKLFFNKNYRI